MNEFLTRIKSPVVLSGIIAQVIVILLLLGAEPEQVETFRLIAVALLQTYVILFVGTNNPTNKNGY